MNLTAAVTVHAQFQCLSVTVYSLPYAALCDQQAFSVVLHSVLHARAAELLAPNCLVVVED